MAAKRFFVQSKDPALLRRARRLGFADLLVAPDQARAADGARPFVLRDGTVERAGRRVGRVADVRGPADEKALRALKGEDGWVFVRANDWRVIPFENLIASFQGRPRLAAFARSVEDARLLLQTLETGVDGLVLAPRDTGELAAYHELATRRNDRVALEPWRVERVEDLPAGERACVDTVHLLRPDEGLLVGSTGTALFLVASEARPGRYVEARPFRVNAGAIHSYVWAGATTSYLSEVHAGTRLRAVDARGRTRTVAVGRSKVETRPLRLVRARGASGSGNVVLQNAETVRLVGPRGRAHAVTDLRVGDRVLVHPETGARHTGIRIDERIVEQ